MFSSLFSFLCYQWPYLSNPCIIDTFSVPMGGATINPLQSHRGIPGPWSHTLQAAEEKLVPTGSRSLVLGSWETILQGSLCVFTLAYRAIVLNYIFKDLWGKRL